jgi:hypothetical protein
MAPAPITSDRTPALLRWRAAATRQTVSGTKNLDPSPTLDAVSLPSEGVARAIEDPGSCL